MWSGHSCPLLLILVLFLILFFSGADTPRDRLRADALIDDEKNQSQRQRTGVSAPHKPAGNFGFRAHELREIESRW